MTDSDPPIEVYWVSGSPFGWRVLLAAELKRVPYVSHRIESSTGEQRSSAYLRLNPRGKVPTLKHGEIVICESLAIMSYLDRLYPEPNLFGTTPYQSACIMQVCSEFVCYLEPVMNRLAAAITRNRPLSAAALAARHGTLHSELTRADGLLRESEWLAGAKVSAADLTVYPHCKFLLRLAAKPEAAALELGLSGFSHRYPALATWMERVETLPGYEKAFPPHWRQKG